LIPSYVATKMADWATKAILTKLLRHGYIGARHTSIDNIPKGFPKHRYGDVKKATKKLIKDGLILAKPTSYGIQVSLNPRRIQEIESMIQS